MLTAVNIVFSDETLLQQEACDNIISQATASGASEREIVDITEQFNWADRLASSGNLSLFAETKLIDIRFSRIPKKNAQQGLIELLKTADENNLFLLRLPKLDKRQKSTQWYKTIVKGANVQEIRSIQPQAFVPWLRQRANKLNLNLDVEACTLLAECTEGNLLAASQNLDKLTLLFAEERIDAKMLTDVISDNARYSVFLCLDEALAGKGGRSVKMLKKFKQESIAPIIILVNLTREIKICYQVSEAMRRGQNAMQALSQSYLWESKKKMIAVAAGRLPLILWQKLIQRCAFLDRMIKGQEQGNIWQELESCLWLVSGKKIWGVKR